MSTGSSDNGRLPDTAGTTQPVATWSATDSFRFLAEAGTILASSLDHETTLANVAQLVVPRLADWCIVHLVSGTNGDITRLAVAHIDPAKADLVKTLQERYPPDRRAPHGIANVVRTCQPELYPDIPDDLLTATAHDEEQEALLRSVGMTSALLVPLPGRDRTLGVLTLIAAESGRRYGRDDLLLVEELARLCGMAVENALLYKRAQATEARYRALFGGVPDSILVLDETGRYVDANPAMEQLSGYSRSELLGMKAGDLAAGDPADRSTLFERLKQGPIVGEDRLRRKDGTTVLVESNAMPVTLPTETIYVAMMRDVSERKRVEAEIRQLTEELEVRVQKRTAALHAANRELEAFSYSVSHDLRAPLRAVDGFSRILLDDHAAELSPDAQRYLHRVRSGAQRMGRLIDDLLLFSHLGRQPLRTQTLSPARVIDRVLELLRGDIEHRPVQVIVDDLPACQADPALLEQVYANLIENALKYTRTRNPAVIELGCAENAEATREQTFFVRDNGVGFDMAYADKLFGVFQRLHRSDEYEGTGVGLAIVQRIIHRHGGRIWAEAAVDRGATFWFTLPTEPAAPDAAGMDG